MAFDIAGLGQWSEEREFKVEAARTVAYAAATNDTNPRHTSGELAPPVFAVVPIWEALGLAVAKVTPPEVIMRVVHGEQDMLFHRPLVAGQVLRSRAAPIGVQVRPSGTTLVVKTESRGEDGELVNEQWMTSFFRGVSEGEGGGETAPEHKLTAEVKGSGVLAEVAYATDEDQTFRYADASGDRMPIHLDENVARAVGLPGIILHGLCTMAFCSRAVIEELAGGDPTTVRRLAVRFSRPVLPGQEITTRFYRAGPGRYAFETVNPEGEAVVKDGLAEVTG